MLSPISSPYELRILSAWVVILHDVGLTVAAAVGLWFTWIGLTTWKRQHIGTTKWDLARRYVKQSLFVRYAVSDARSALQRIPVERKEGDTRINPTEEEQNVATRKFYRDLWNGIVEKMSELDVLALELRAAGESDFESLNKELSKLLWQFSFASRDHLDSDRKSVV